MADETVKVTETTKEYELQKADIVPSHGDDEPTWYTSVLVCWISFVSFHD